jgi:tRNA(fMet)-specific endonuclease VapC
MIPAPRSLLLDTGIVVLLCRGGDAGKQLDARYGLTWRRDVPLVSVISVGELRAFARNASWGGAKEMRLKELLGNLTIVDVNRDPVLTAYADVSAHLKQSGRPIGQNDIWIAATARATGATLLTTDKDFDVLHPALIQREYVAPDLLRQPPPAGERSTDGGT